MNFDQHAIDPETYSLTQANSSPDSDPECLHWVQNPITYSAPPKVKFILMISAKVSWDDCQNSFDQLKVIVEGPFTGHHAFHLIHPDFMKDYLKEGAWVILYYPTLKFTYLILDQQNCVLFGSLQQICWGKTARALINRFLLSVRADSQKTSKNFLVTHG